jgi:competence protein ComEC
MVLIAFTVTAIAMGFTVARWHATATAAPVIKRRLGPTNIEGTVIALEPGLKGARVTLADPRIRRLEPAATPVRVRLRLRGMAAGVHIGNRVVALTAILMPPPAPSAPGAYDFARDAWFRQLGGVGLAFGAPRILARVDEAGGRGIWAQFKAGLAETRRAFHARITGTLAGESGAVASALMTGERGDIPPEVMDAMRASGLAHLLAISGLHIGLVTGVLFFGLRAVLALFPVLALRYLIKKWGRPGGAVRRGRLHDDHRGHGADPTCFLDGGFGFSGRFGRPFGDFHAFGCLGGDGGPADCARESFGAELPNVFCGRHCSGRDL